MKIVALSGSIVGTKTKTVMQYVVEQVAKKAPDAEVTFIDLSEYDVQFSDGRLYTEYTGDTAYVTNKLMEADAIIIGTPIFQASIPGTLKNIFDLLPEKAFRDKVVSIVVTAGSPKHYLVVEQQLKPILSYMKAQVVPAYVFVEGKDINRQAIINEDVFFRADRLVEDTLLLVETYTHFRLQQEALYF